MGSHNEYLYSEAPNESELPDLFANLLKQHPFYWQEVLEQFHAPQIFCCELCSASYFPQSTVFLGIGTELA